MRISNYLKKEFLAATQIAFGACELKLFGSRIDDSKKGGDFDIAVICNMTKEQLKNAKIKFFKYLLLKDIDLPIDLVFYHTANKDLKREIDKGITL